MSDKPIQKRAALERRLRKYFAHARPRFEGVFQFARSLESIGQVAVFGGALRDFYLNGPAHSPRDVDLVIDTSDLAALEKYLLPFAPIRNKFGGYRLLVGQWPVDLWPVSSTWAFRMGHVENAGLQSLPKTTFLTSDAIVYVLGEEKVYCTDQYLIHLNQRLLDVNLEQNPNPLGCVVRAMRASVLDRFALQPNLMQFVVEHYREFEAELPEALAAAFGYRVNFEAMQEAIQEMESCLREKLCSSYRVSPQRWKQEIEPDKSMSLF